MIRRGALLLAAAAALAPASVVARVVPTGFQDQLVIGGLFEPQGLEFLPDGRLLVIERPGRLRLVVDGKLGAVDPLLVPDSVDVAGAENGLLGVAVDPDWPARPCLYLSWTHAGGTLRVARYQAGGDLTDGNSVFLFVDPASRFDVLRDVPNLRPGRDGGALHFAPDGALWMALGDDSAGCDAQDTTAWRGRMLRLGVQSLPLGPGQASLAQLALPDNPFAAHAHPRARLVGALGLAHPLRFRIDPRDGTVLIGDVSEAVQEIDVLAPAGGHFGWPGFDGMSRLEPGCAGPDSTALAFPAHAYDDVNGAGLARVVCGGVYLASPCSTCSFPEAYEGDVFVADERIGFVRRLDPDQGWTLAEAVAGQPNATDWGLGFAGIRDLLTGPDGALWYCIAGTGGADGSIGRVHWFPAPTSAVGESSGPRIAFAAPYPSPSSSAVHFRFALAAPALVRLDVLDLAGRRVRGMTLGERSAGAHETVWDGRDEGGRLVPAGAYLARLHAGRAVVARTATIVR